MPAQRDLLGLLDQPPPHFLPFFIVVYLAVSSVFLAFSAGRQTGRMHYILVTLGALLPSASHSFIFSLVEPVLKVFISSVHWVTSQFRGLGEEFPLRLTE